MRLEKNKIAQRWKKKREKEFALELGCNSIKIEDPSSRLIVEL